MTTAILLVEARGQSMHCREDSCVNLVQAAWLAPGMKDPSRALAILKEGALQDFTHVRLPERAKNTHSDATNRMTPSSAGGIGSRRASGTTPDGTGASTLTATAPVATGPERVWKRWYAPGIGMVKLEADGGRKVLKEFTPGKK